MAPFVVDGGQVLEGEMAPMGIVEALDVFEDGHFCRGPRPEDHPLQVLAFEAGESGLPENDVVGVPRQARAGLYIGLPTP